MKKSLTLSVVLLSTTLFAVDTQWFIGAGISSADIDAKLNQNGTITIGGVAYTTGSSDQSDRDNALELKAGAILDKKHRLSVDYAKYEPSKGSINTKLTNATLNYDYLLDPVNQFTFFAGMHGGINKFEAIGYDDQAFTYGVQGGVLYPLVSGFELEAAVSYSKLGTKPSTPTLNGTYSGIIFSNASASLEANDMTAFHFGINYKF